MPKINRTVEMKVQIKDITAKQLRSDIIEQSGIPLKAPDGSIISDDSIQASIDAEISMFEEKCSTPLEPIKVFTPVNPANVAVEGADIDYHEIGTKIDYRKSDNTNVLSINLPTSNLISVERVCGTYGVTEHWPVPPEWIKFRKNGRIDIIPTYGIPMSYPFGAGGMSFSGHMMNVVGANQYCGYWAINYTYGLDGIPLSLANYIKLSASIIIIENLATSFSPGIASKSMSVGGISQSTSYTASAEFSLYSALTKTLKEKLKSINEDDMIRSVRGIKIYSL